MHEPKPFVTTALRTLLTDPAGFFRKAHHYLRPRPAPYRRRFRMRLDEWLLHHQRTITFDQCRWMGVHAFKNPLDAWIYQEILWDVKPDVIVEIGSAQGGTTLYLAHLLELIGHGLVLSVDIDRSRFNVSHPRIRTVTGDSGSPGIIDAVRRECAGKKVLVIHDADHTKPAVVRDLEIYAPLVSPGSYLIVEDGILDLFRPGDSIGSGFDGPLPAIEEFLARHPEFAVDEARERYFLTYNPRGYLRRVA